MTKRWIPVFTGMTTPLFFLSGTYGTTSSRLTPPLIWTFKTVSLGGLLAVSAFCVLVLFSAVAYSGEEHGYPTPWGGISQSGVSDSENPPPVKSPARDGQPVKPGPDGAVGHPTKGVDHPTGEPTAGQRPGPQRASDGPPAPADSGEVQQPETLRDWYIKHYDFFSMKDTVFTFETEFEFPDGYKRPDSAELTPFQNWVSHFPLWHRWKPIGMWRGSKVFEADQVSRAVHLPWKGIVFRDYAIPLRILAEFLRYQHCEFDLHVIPKLGDTLRYEDWLKGKPVSTSGGEVFFKPSEQREHDPYEYYRFLNLCMRNTSYPSLAENCDSITENEVALGDLFIAHDEKGKTGSVYVILNMLVNKTGEKLFAVATGCPEACDFHIPLFNNNRDYPWITSKRIKTLGADMPYSGFFRFRIE